MEPTLTATFVEMNIFIYPQGPHATNSLMLHGKTRGQGGLLPVSSLASGCAYLAITTLIPLLFRKREIGIGG